MADKLYMVSFAITVRSQYTSTPPQILLKFDKSTIYQGNLLESQTFDYHSPALPAGSYRISLEFFNKDDQEQIVYGKDMMVGIDRLTVENQPTDFSIYSRYRPTYPTHWYQENLAKGIVLEEIIKSNYMGWNGVWYLDIELPIFRWVHKTTGMGWLI